MAQYTGVLLRQNLQDSGAIPRTGGWTASPDLIAAGTIPLTDPQKTLSSATSYGSDPTQPVVQNAPNYVYLRGKNLGSAATDVEARAFWAPQSLFLYPSQWMQNGLQTSTGNAVSKISSLAAGAIGATTDPFSWVPGTTSEHYCLVGFLSTTANPFSSQKPPNAVTSLDDLAAWIGKTGGTGWHNVQWASDSATFSSSTTYPASTTSNLVHLTITCVDVPVGAQVSFSCGTPLPNGQIISLPKTTVTSTQPIGFFLEVTIPANWTSPITYSYWANGTSGGGANFSVSMSADIVKQSSDDAFAEYTRPRDEVYADHRQFDLEAQALVDAGGADMPVRYILPVGSDTTLLLPDAQG